MISKNKSKVSAIVKVKEDGSIIIPEEIRDEFKINLGDEIMLMGEKGKGLLIVKNDLMLKMMKQKQ